MNGRIRIGLLAAIALLTLSALTPSSAQEASPVAAPNATRYPLTIENCGQQITFEHAPERVVPLDPLTAEFMLRLGLGDRIVGAGLTNGDPVAPDLLATYATLPVLSTDAPPSREVLLAAKPDLVLDNFPFFYLDPNSGFASAEQLAAQGAAVYTLTARCTGNETTRKLTDLFTDVSNLGAIFAVQDRAATLVAQMRERLATVQAKIAGLPPVKVLIYEDGKSPLEVYGPGALSDVVQTAGGQNVFGDLPDELNLLSAEEVAVANPDVIIVLDHQGSPPMSMTAALTFEEKVEVLKSTFPDSNAVKNDRFVSLPYQQIYASLQNIDGVEALARAFYPDAFRGGATPVAPPSS